MEKTVTYYKPKSKKRLVFDVNKEKYFLIRKSIGLNLRLFNTKLIDKNVLVKKKITSHINNNRLIFKIREQSGIIANITFIKKINSYRGKRHQLCLSVRGQRTKTNCRTQKKKQSFIKKKSLNKLNVKKKKK